MYKASSKYKVFNLSVSLTERIVFVYEVIQCGFALGLYSICRFESFILYHLLHAIGITIPIAFVDIEKLKSHQNQHQSLAFILCRR